MTRRERFAVWALRKLRDGDRRMKKRIQDKAVRERRILNGEELDRLRRADARIDKANAALAAAKEKENEEKMANGKA